MFKITMTKNFGKGQKTDVQQYKRSNGTFVEPMQLETKIFSSIEEAQSYGYNNLSIPWSGDCISQYSNKIAHQNCLFKIEAI